MQYKTSNYCCETGELRRHTYPLTSVVPHSQILGKDKHTQLLIIAPQFTIFLNK